MLTLIGFLGIIGFVANTCDAAKITSLSTSVPDDWGDGANVTAHLAADEDIYFIDWTVRDKDGNIVYNDWSLHGNGIR